MAFKKPEVPSYECIKSNFVCFPLSKCFKLPKTRCQKMTHEYEREIVFESWFIVKDDGQASGISVFRKKYLVFSYCRYFFSVSVICSSAGLHLYLTGFEQQCENQLRTSVCSCGYHHQCLETRTSTEREGNAKAVKACNLTHLSGKSWCVTLQIV